MLRPPARATTPRDKFRFYARAWVRLHDQARAERALYPKKLSADQLVEMRAWLREVWNPRMKRLSVPRNLAKRRLRETLTGLDPETMQNVLHSHKEAGATDSSWDADIDLGEV